tara:strand:- start:71150 stop:71698 length:549 start_codon:yes stop_codon:yes gene_type:complete
VTKKKRILGKHLKKNLESQNIILNGAIGIVGVLLIGFIISFSRNTSQSGITIDVTFPEIEDRPRLAVEVFEKNPIQDIKIEVLNGCGIQGLAAKTAEFLRSKQLDVVRSDDADHHNYSKTLIIQRNENIESLKRVSDSFGVLINDQSRIKIVPDETLGIDVTVILGKDYKSFPDFNSFLSSN